MIHIRFLAKRCVLCQFKHHGQHAVCEHCFHYLPRLQHPCTRCATPLFDTSLAQCRPCLLTPPMTDKLTIHYAFVEPLRSLIHTYKFQHGLYLSSFLSKLMLSHADCEEPPELLIPVPLHYARLSTRGFNQASLITTHLSRALHIPYDAHCCKKIKHTPPQASLPANLRMNNLIDTFQVSSITQRHVALIDDVYTTGTTVNALAQLLKEKGVERVDVWCVAKTLPPSLTSSRA
ncbi:MAG: phosphoribosyltransferase family protein [Gammaproteobacteria bacterium]|nr:phosphoribosyltransferase family protein [Gammaproteobacteria bacterium]